MRSNGAVAPVSVFCPKKLYASRDLSITAGTNADENLGDAAFLPENPGDRRDLDGYSRHRD
jgi:hypothetical protein